MDGALGSVFPRRLCGHLSGPRGLRVFLFLPGQNGVHHWHEQTGRFRRHGTPDHVQRLLK